jgi:hypothetical protein
MRANLFGILFCFLFISLNAQTRLNLGFTAGPIISWGSPDSKFQNDFFKSGKAGYNAGISLTLQGGEHFFSRLSTLYSTQIFAISQTSNINYKIDNRLRFHQFEIPLVVGFTGYIGSLKHREYVGAAMSFNLNTSQKFTRGDSLPESDFSLKTDKLNKAFPLLMAGFEIGSQFKNDAGLFFGINLRYGLNSIYSGSLNSNRFGYQNPMYNGTYIGIEVTYYLPRFSYWFKREFIY